MGEPMKITTIIILAIIFLIVLYLSKGKSLGLPSPGEVIITECSQEKDCPPNYACDNSQCILQYPQNDTCDGVSRTFLGKPAFWKDPAMQHMINSGCSNDNQCHKWPPESFNGPDSMVIECCLNKGRCYI